MNIAIIWLWNHWKKYINFFEKKDLEVFWACKTRKTKNYIESNYHIKVFLDYKELIKTHRLDFIVLALPQEIQWKIALNILKKVSKKTKILIELPVCDSISDREALEKFENVWFFIEEYYSLLSSFLRKIDISNISSINVSMYVSAEDFWDEKSQNIDKIHLMNNFVWLWIDYNIFDIKIYKHDDINVYFDINFSYLWKKINYSFFEKKILKIWNKQFIDNFNFDEVINSLLVDFSPSSKSKKDFNRLFKEINW